MIHFQHDRDGATLRASDVKPRLDKYIIKLKGLKRVTEQEDSAYARF